MLYVFQDIYRGFSTATAVNTLLRAGIAFYQETENGWFFNVLRFITCSKHSEEINSNLLILSQSIIKTIHRKNPSHAATGFFISLMLSGCEEYSFIQFPQFLNTSFLLIYGE